MEFPSLGVVLLPVMGTHFVYVDYFEKWESRDTIKNRWRLHFSLGKAFAISHHISPVNGQ